MLACRRVTFEWVLRREALAPAAHRVPRRRRGARAPRASAAARACACTASRSRPAAASRRSTPTTSSTRRAAARSFPPGSRRSVVARPREEAEDCGIYYCSRFYRLPRRAADRRDDDRGRSRLPEVRRLPRRLRDLLDHVRREPRRRAAPRAAPRAALRGGGGGAPRRRHRGWRPASPSRSAGSTAWGTCATCAASSSRTGGRVAPGVLAIGDAAIHTNPLYGRGCTFALRLRRRPARGAARARRRRRRRGARARGASEREIVPWYKISVAQDRDAVEVAERWRRGEDARRSRARGGRRGRPEELPCAR